MATLEDQSAPRESGLAETLASYRTGEDISEHDAMTLVKAELAAARWDHQTMLRMAEASADETEAELFGE